MPHSTGFHTFASCGERGRDASRAGERRHSGRPSATSARVGRRPARDPHAHASDRVVAGLLGLLAFCAEARGKSNDPERSLSEIGAKLWSADRQPHAILRAFGARPLPCSAAPELYAVLLTICVRARMTRVPELFLLPVPGMNAFALGGPDDACISVTEGLLRGLSRAEIGGILAHEIAHILHHDTGAMSWAAALQREITDSASRGIAELMARPHEFSRPERRAVLLTVAPALAQLLFLALSRARELAADARALDLIDRPEALAEALYKLEYFHTGQSPLHAHLQDDARSASLRSHPGTWERIFRLA